MKKIIITEGQLGRLKNKLNEGSLQSMVVRQMKEDLDMNYSPVSKFMREGGEYYETPMIEIKVDGEIITPKSLYEYMKYKYKMGEEFTKQVIRDWMFGKIADDYNAKSNQFSGITKCTDMPDHNTDAGNKFYDFIQNLHIGETFYQENKIDINEEPIYIIKSDNINIIKFNNIIDKKKNINILFDRDRISRLNGIEFEEIKQGKLFNYCIWHLSKLLILNGLAKKKVFKNHYTI